MTTHRAAFATFLAIGLAGCPGKKTEPTGPGKPDGVKNGEVAAQDTTLDYEAVELPGTYFVPEGLDRPLMQIVTPTKKLTLAKQRQAYAKAKLDHKVGEAEILSTMLYQAAQKEADDGKRFTMVEEARKLLADVRVIAPKYVDVVLLHNLACLSYDVADYAGATEALAAAVALKPTDAGADERRAYLAYYYVREGRNADAAATVAGITATAAKPELAYAIAWSAWRTGDLDTARSAMLDAVKGWQLKSFLPAIKRDVLIFAARTGASVDDAVAMASAYATLVKDQPHLQGDVKTATFEILAVMHQAFKLAGRLADSIALIDQMLAIKKDVDKPALLKLRFEQADSAQQLGRSEDLIKFDREALAALKACGAACAGKESESAIKLVFGHARFANYLYTTAQDEIWYTATLALYELYLAIPGITDAATVKPEADTVVNNHARAVKNAGKHDKDAIKYVVSPYATQVLACYDRYLQIDATLGGLLTLRLEIAASGEVTGASAEPAAGEDGIAAVSACAIEAARTWVFPARNRPGVTRLSAAYKLQPPAAK